MPVEPLSFDRAADAVGGRVEDERRMDVDGRATVRFEVVSTAGPVTPPGQRSVRYVVDGGRERAILATTSEGEGNDFDRSVAVLDRIVRAFDIEPLP